MTTSVALCTYNGSRFIERQLESIACQTCIVDEIVICDDNSKDDTCILIKKFIRHHPELNIVFIQNEQNIGFLKNFEKALSCCTKDIIFLCDQDDIWMPRKVTTFIDFFEKHDKIDVVFSNARLINATGTAYYSKTLFDIVGLDEKNKRLFSRGFASDLLSISGRMTGCASAVRSSFLPYFLPFKELSVKPIHDEIIAVIAASYDKIGIIDQCLLSYRQHDTQTVGISLLFKFPPQHQEKATLLRGWDKEILGPFNENGIKRFDFIEDRFWAQRSLWGCCSFFIYLLKGRYHNNYSQPLLVFYEDLSGYFRRRLSFIKDLPKKRISLVMKYCWNG